MSAAEARRAAPISIHVLRVEDDRAASRRARRTTYFNPRPPCGGRPTQTKQTEDGKIFQSTSSVWRTTIFNHINVAHAQISIHVLRVEDDLSPYKVYYIRRYFNPRPPCGGRQVQIQQRKRQKNFNPRPPCGGRRDFFVPYPHPLQFQSTSSVWRTTAKTEKNLYLHSYNTAICIDLQSHQSVHAHVCTNNPKQSPKKPVRSIRVRSARFTFARPSPPGEALRKSERHPAGRRGELRYVQPCFDNGCPAGKSAGCPLPGRSIWPVQP